LENILSFHLEGPWLSTTGKKKGKQKFRNAEQARKSRECKDSWEQMLKQYGIEQEDRKRNRALKAPVLKDAFPAYRGSEKPKLPSSNPSTWGTCAKPDQKEYTGDAIVGISTLHKSNAVPVFSKQDAIDISNMRR
jgi:hypothetical protein